METRNISTYTELYLKDNYEKYQVEYRREQILSIIKAKCSRRILEIGCGKESLATYYRDFDAFLVVEPSPVFVEMARKKLSNLDKVTFINGFFGDENVTNQIIKFITTNGDFDMIICSSLIHELVDYAPVLSAIYKVAGEKTTIHINVPNSHSFHNVWAYKAGLISSIDALSDTAKAYQRHHTFDAVLLRKTMEQHGFDVLNEGGYSFKLFNNAKMEKLLHDGIINEPLQEALQAMSELLPQYAAEIYVNCKKRLI